MCTSGCLIVLFGYTSWYFYNQLSDLLNFVGLHIYLHYLSTWSLPYAFICSKVVGLLPRMLEAKLGGSSILLHFTKSLYKSAPCYHQRQVSYQAMAEAPNFLVSTIVWQKNSSFLCFQWWLFSALAPFRWFGACQVPPRVCARRNLEPQEEPSGRARAAVSREPVRDPRQPCGRSRPQMPRSGDRRGTQHHHWGGTAALFIVVSNG